MKKTIITILIIAIILTLVGCTEMERVQKPVDTSMFVIVEGGGPYSYIIAYHKETKVMYAISNGTYNAGIFTVMVNPDGSPMLWESP
jgi:uncharacterized lipoprotein NlpE involved in copper resistance